MYICTFPTVCPTSGRKVVSGLGCDLSWCAKRRASVGVRGGVHVRKVCPTLGRKGVAGLRIGGIVRACFCSVGLVIKWNHPPRAVRG